MTTAADGPHRAYPDVVGRSPAPSAAGDPCARNPRNDWGRARWRHCSAGERVSSTSTSPAILMISFSSRTTSLSPTAEIAFVIASPVPTDDNGGQIGSIERGVVAAQALLDLLDSNLPVIGGSKDSLMDVSSSQPSAAAGAIVREAMRDDTELPLFVALGGGLTELASAYLIEPRIRGKTDSDLDRWTGVRRSGAHAVARRCRVQHGCRHHRRPGCVPCPIPSGRFLGAVIASARCHGPNSTNACGHSATWARISSEW
jgi:hypothetical protein